MKEKSTKIIFETSEIRRIYIAGQLNKPAFVEPPEILNDSLFMKRPGGFKARWREKLREFWKLSHRRVKYRIQKGEFSLLKTREDK